MNNKKEEVVHKATSQPMRTNLLLQVAIHSQSMHPKGRHWPVALEADPSQCSNHSQLPHFESIHWLALPQSELVEFQFK